jgi:hypothetical protein
MTRRWTAEDVRKMLTNPVYAGMGPYPALVEEEVWLKSNAIRIEREGAKAVVEGVLMRFQETFPDLRTPAAGPYVEEAESDPDAALRHLLADLRDLAAIE